MKVLSQFRRIQKVLDERRQRSAQDLGREGSRRRLQLPSFAAGYCNLVRLDAILLGMGEQSMSPKLARSL